MYITVNIKNEPTLYVKFLSDVVFFNVTVPTTSFPDTLKFRISGSITNTKTKIYLLQKKDAS